MVSWIIFGILGYLNDGSKLAGVYKDYGWFINGVGSFGSILLNFFDIKSIKDKLFPIEKKAIKIKDE